MNVQSDLVRTARIRLWKHLLGGFRTVGSEPNSFLIKSGADVVDEFVGGYVEGFDRIGWNPKIEEEIHRRGVTMAAEIQ